MKEKKIFSFFLFLSWTHPSLPGSSHLKEIFEKSPTPDKMIPLNPPPSGTASAYYDRNVLLNEEAQKKKKKKRKLTLAPIDPLVSGGRP